MNAESPGRVFPGWWVVLISACALLLGPIPIAVLSFGVFVKPLAAEFQAGRALVSFAFTLHNLALAVSIPIAGRLVDRFGAKRVIVPATILAGLILLSSNLCDGEIWRLHLFYFALGLVESGTGPVPWSDVVARWFDSKRGLAFGLMMFGLGAGALVMPPVAQYLVTKLGWSITFTIAGSAILLFTVPIVSIFLKERRAPEAIATFDQAYGVAGGYEDPGVDWSDASRTRTFWLLLCAFVLVSASVHGCFTHMASILVDRGSPEGTAALVTSLFGVGLLVGRTGLGYLLDRFFAPHVASLVFCFTAAGISLLWISHAQELGLIAAFLIGMGVGAEVDIMAYLTSRYFGLRFFGAVYGLMFAGFVLAGGLGAWFMGVAFDETGSYAAVLALFCVASLAGAALVLRLGPYRFATQHSVEADWRRTRIRVPIQPVTGGDE
jgi:MFS family permease